MCKNILSVALLFSWFIVSGTAIAEVSKCELDNAKLRAMPVIEVELIRSDDTRKIVTAKLANNNATRAAGFQRVCESTIKAMPILFVFNHAVTPQFHMHNVVAPIDIAFIDGTGAIDSLHAMTPYVLASKKRPLYGPTGPVVAAFEVHKGFYEDNNIDLQSRIVWRDKIVDE
ncbi:DUF192 domain-containing protein [Arenicella xantha]|uniref:Uncharacterized membrane protein (UPF0127 family) n=1 Tax=Arenicella xantha TaxID=644221 RepID=A0A395JMT1_9GAMM|nr:DUF192 domain-containing protein [Arenicella xantha]RBP49204.1 uncharacterized membrane protein (UPF0127 family) [Arenicella xantha]